MSRIAILGAGVAGLSSGWLLKQKGIDFLVLEKQSYSGGLARSFDWHGFSCDFAAHRLFTNDKAVLQQLLALVPMGRHIRRSRIYLGGHWLRDPLDAIELVFHLPLAERAIILWSYITRPKNLPEESFENFVIRRYGRGLYSRFFQPYTEKLFGIPGREISVLWARRKVRLANPLDNILRENTKSKFQYFYYPLRGGYGSIANRLYNEIQEHVLLSSQVVNLEREGNRIKAITYNYEGKECREPVDTVISTLPLTITSRMLGYSLKLQYQKVDAVYLLINRSLVSDNHWLYFVDDDIAINRLVEFKNMSAVDTPEDVTVLCAEVTQFHEDVAAKVSADLSRVGLIRQEDILDTKVVREEFAYPVYDRLYDETLRQARDVLGKIENLYLVGRAAEFEHREVDDNFAAAQEVIAKILPRITAPVHVEERKVTRTEPRMPLVYAVILALDNCNDTLECLESVTRSDYADLRIVLVDNGSADETPRRVRDRYPQIVVIENGKNLGVPAGYNIGFAHALNNGADYVLMLNNDTTIAPETLTTLVSKAESDPHVAVVMPKVFYYGSEKQIWSGGWRYRRFPPSIVPGDSEKSGAIFSDTNRLIEYAPSCGLLIHRRAFERAGLFDPGYLFTYDDWDFSERVRAHGLHIWYAPEAYMWHKVSRTTKGPRSPLFWRTYATSGVRFYRRHGRPVWLSLPAHMGWVTAREFLIKGTSNWQYWRDYWQGLVAGLRQPLEVIPTFEMANSSNQRGEEH